MRDIRKFITKTSFKIIAAIILCTIISIIISSVTPHLTNDIAISQLQNEDINWTFMNSWNQICNYAGVVYGIIAIAFSISIFKDFHTFLKNRKDMNNNEENN